MIWQDLVLTAAGLVFALNLIPTIREQYRRKASTVNWVTSATSFPFLFLMAAVFLSMGFWFTFTMDILVAIAWMVIFLQTIRYEGFPTRRKGST